MRLIALVFGLVLALGLAQAYPLSGGNAAVNCTLFGSTKVPVPGTDPNATVQDYILKVDVGLLGNRNATFELVDSKDEVYSPDPSMSWILYPSSESYIREILAFVVPKDALFKLFKVSPSVGEPFSIKWWKTPKKSHGDLTMRYYGVVDSKTAPDEQSVTYDVGIQNAGTNSIPLSPLNFTLLDQSGWEYYTVYGFSPIYLDANKSMRVRLNFSSISYLSKPAFLAFDYSTPNQIIFDLDKDTGPLTDAQVYGTAAPEAASSTSASTLALSKTVAAAEAVRDTSLIDSVGNNAADKQQISGSVQSLTDQINASKERLANMGRIGGNSSVESQIGSKVNEALARLGKMKEGLPKGQNSS